MAWLNEDLCVSAWMWQRVAAFMRSKGYYVLYGATINPSKLALRRGTAGSVGCMFTSIEG